MGELRHPSGEGLQRLGQRVDEGGPRSHLERRAALYFEEADSSHRTYRSGENRFLRFCELSGCAPLPLAENKNCANLYHTWGGGGGGGGSEATDH